MPRRGGERWRGKAGLLLTRPIEKTAALGYIEWHMPIFEYQCRNCGSRFEKISYASGAEILCKNCSSPKVEKLLSVFAVSGSSHERLSSEAGPCPCGAPRRGMCGE
ncbi:MAG TPA: zinc ribbon domain-containing protein [Terriglobia bacterium]|nr:zinc ribbon domain-containing protein [Terriglobia bacterium]